MRAEAAAAMSGVLPISIDQEVAKYSWVHTGSQEAGHFEGTPFVRRMIDPADFQFDLVENLCKGAHRQ